MKRYIPLILIEGATVMAVELCGAKQLAPMYGGSLFVWAAILAVTLGALAFGYYYGGVLSSKNEPQKKLFNIILIASCSIMLMPFIALYITPPLSYLNFKIAVVLSASVLIFVPIFFLGCTTPLLVRINTGSAENSGLISGKIYAISTVGGIISTLLCGFYLIPHIGLKLTLIGFGALLFIVGSLVLKTFKVNNTLMFFVALLLAFKSIMGYDNNGVKYFSYGIMGDVAVKDEDSVRKLYINKTVQSEMDIASGNSVSEYIKSIDSIVPTQQRSRKALILGLGGGLLSNLIRKKNFSVDAVEFDPRVIETAKVFFDLDKAVACYDVDARKYINQCKEKYDLIIFDLFKAEEQPFHTITKECFMKAHSLLNDSGSVIVNWHGYLEGDLGKGTQILINTLAGSGFESKLMPGAGLEDYRNTIIVCKPIDKNDFDPNIPVNTDDQPIIELANAKANLRWRQNYLRYYQSSR